jgi:hypothetical protein
MLNAANELFLMKAFLFMFYAYDKKDKEFQPMRIITVWETRRTRAGYFRG